MRPHSFQFVMTVIAWLYFSGVDAVEYSFDGHVQTFMKSLFDNFFSLCEDVENTNINRIVSACVEKITNVHSFAN